MAIDLFEYLVSNGEMMNEYIFCSMLQCCRELVSVEDAEKVFLWERFEVSLSYGFIISP